MKRRPPKRPTKRKPATRESRHAKRTPKRPAPRPIKRSTKKSPKPPTKKPSKRPAKKPPTKKPPRRRASPKPPTFADEIRAIVDRSHSTTKIKPSVFEFANRKWDTFEMTMREEVPIDEIPFIAKAVEKKFRSRFKGAVRTTYLGIERDEEGSKISDHFITLKSATQGGFQLQNELEALKPDASGRYGTFKKLRFELKRAMHYGRSKNRKRSSRQ